MACCAGLVLSGGGVRGAYEVGVVAGIIETLGIRASDEIPFRIFSGTSVGAINASFLASHASQGNLGIDDLIKLWTGLRLNVHLKFTPPTGWWHHSEAGIGWSLVDPEPLAKLITERIPWGNLEPIAQAGTLKALIVAALDVATGQTTMFAQVGKGTQFRPSRDPRRNAICTNIGPEHILASAALPLVFPARKIGEDYFYDGGIRSNTPIAPAIRCGADRLIIVPLLKRKRPQRLVRQYPSPTFLAGKVLNALLSDRVEYDLQLLNRLNRMIEVLETTLTPNEMKRVDQVLTETRGAPYRRLHTLVFRPSEDIGLLAGDHIRHQVTGVTGWLFRKILQRSGSPEADWASYVLFDGKFAARLIELGIQDTKKRKQDILRFFDTDIGH